MSKYISQFTGEEIDSRLSLVDEKIGATYFDSTTMMQYAFRTEEDRDEWLASGDSSLVLRSDVFNFTGTLNQLKVVNKMESTLLYFTTTSQSALISFSFISQQKGITDTSWEEVMEDAEFNVYVDKGSTGKYEQIASGTLLYGDTYTVDVYKYIATGANRVRVSMKGVITGAEGNLVYSVNLTTMYLSPSNFAWNNAFIEGQTYNLGGVNIGGNIDKILKVKLSNDDLGYERMYEQKMGTSTYITNAYFFKGLEFPETGTGVYDVELWLDANGLESDHINYKIICVASADVPTARLVAISDVPESLMNYDSNTLFRYVIYNGGSSVASPTVRIVSDLGSIREETLKDVATGAINVYSAPIEIETEDSNLAIEATITFGNTETATYKLDNSASFPAVQGSVFYLQPSGRSNAQDNREVIINQSTGEEISAKWRGVSFVDGIDGYTTIGVRKCLYIPAYSNVDIGYKPLASVGEGKTIEFNFMVDNISDYDEPIISICDDATNKNFRGILVYPDRVIVHTRDLNTNDLVQSYQFGEGQPINMQVSYTRNYKTNYGNLITIAVNGGKKKEFSFSSSDNVGVSANIVLGSNSSDLSLYSMRVYNEGFDSPKIMQNFINSLPTKDERVFAFDTIQSAIDDSYDVSYDKVKGKKNTMVIRMLNGAELPHYGLSKEYSAYCNVKFDFCNLPDFMKIAAWIFILNMCRIEGQGTTSMNYWIWNLRFRLDKSGNLVVIYPDGTESTDGKVWFDGVGVHPMVARITAKKNYASQTQGNKMGATGAFNDLHEAIGLTNEAGARVAVYQYPVFGFLEIPVDGTTDEYTYKFIGMYTVGPDKGDKPTFGWDNKEYKDTMLSLEGLDHNIKGAGYDYPYDKLRYSLSAESIINDKGEAGTEVSNSGSAETEEEIQAKLDAEYKPAYEVAYMNNPLIKGTTATLEEMNANTEAWGLQKDEDGHAYQRFEFWIDGEYNILYLNKKSNLYEKNGVNLLTQLGIDASELDGKTVEEKNAYFINKRVERFKQEVQNYWHIRDNMFALVFKQMFGAKDNGIKNTYPYKFALLAQGGLWRQRQDDLDSLFPWDNQGLASAKFWQEIYDFSNDDKTAYVYKGEHNVLDHLLLLAYPDLEQEIAHQMFDAMQELSKYGSTTIDKLMGFFRTYFFDKAQYYFPKSVYNKDTEYAYEDAWPHYVDGSYDVDVNPLSQITGDALETVMEWIEKHIIYMMSKYHYGPFGDGGYNDTSLGRINFRTQLSQSLTLTPAIPLYPAVANGVNTVNATSRIMDGEEVTINGVGGTNTNVYIMAADYLSDIGDLSTLQVDSNQDAVISVASKRLKRLKVGDEVAEKVTSNLSGLNIGKCQSLTLIDARNLSSLSGVVNLAQCPRLQEALFAATDVREIKLQNGSKIVKLSLPDSLTTLAMMNLRNLSEENIEYGALGNVEFFRVEGCLIDGFKLLKSLYMTEGNSLLNIRLIGFAYDGDTTDIDMLSSLAETCTGIDNQGNPSDTMFPVIEGTLNIDGCVYEDTYLDTISKYPSLVINLSGGFYVRFADPEVLRVLLANITTDDGLGLTTEDIEGVTSIGGWFEGNTTVQTFDEFEKFTNVTSLMNTDTNSDTYGAFRGCTGLKNVTLPPNITVLGYGAFFGCTSLTKLEGLTNVSILRTSALRNCTSLVIDDLSLPNLTSLGQYALHGVNIKKISNLGKITSFPTTSTTMQNFGSKSVLEEVVLPSTLTTIPENCFYGYSKLNKINLESIKVLQASAFSGCSSLVIDELRLPNLTSISEQAFRGCHIVSVEDMGKITKLPSSQDSRATWGATAYLKKVVLPNTLTAIANYAFMNYNQLDSVVIPDTVTSVGSYAFHVAIRKGSELELDLPNVKTIGERAFYKSGLGKITLNGLTGTVPTRCFSEASIRYAELGEGVTGFAGEVFSASGNFATLILHAKTPPTLSGTNFYNNSSALKICVPMGRTTITSTDDSGNETTTEILIVDAYKQATGWTGYKTRIFSQEVLDPTCITFADPAVKAICVANWDTNYGGEITEAEAAAVTSIGTAFKGNTEITSFDEFEKFTGVVQLPNDADDTKLAAFSGCSSLESITLPSGLELVGGYAFYDTNLCSINLENVTNIKRCAFWRAGQNNNNEFVIDCRNLKSVDSSAFSESGITEVIHFGANTLPDHVSFRGVFSSCAKLRKSVVDGVETIGSYAFSNCSSLLYVDIGVNCSNIREYAFINCTSLERIVIRAITPPTITSNIFNNTNSIFSIYVPDDSVDAYKSATNWASYASRIYPFSEYVEE